MKPRLASKPAYRRPRNARANRSPPEGIPNAATETDFTVEGRTVRLTNLDKVFWPKEGITKGDLLRYYAEISGVLLPHLVDRAVVMKRYPNGIEGKFFFQKRAPDPRPEWIETCKIEHAMAGLVDFPVIRDLATLLWVVNLGSIDLNPWYARCDAPERPDYLHFDLDPVEGADFQRVCDCALLVHQALEALKMPNYAKTTGSRGIHVYVPIVRGPTQKRVWEFAKDLARSLEGRHPELITAEYRKAKRPKSRILVDYNQNAWGRTLASVYSVRPRPQAPVSTPVTWAEIESGIRLEDFRLETVPERVRRMGDLWQPLLARKGRFNLAKMLASQA